MQIEVDTLLFDVQNNFTVIKYDELYFFQLMSSKAYQFSCECINCASHTCKEKKCEDYSKCQRKHKKEGMKGVDLIAFSESEKQLFLIESKDFRTTRNTVNVDHISSEVAKKYRDTLFGIWSASICNEDDATLKKIENNLGNKEYNNIKTTLLNIRKGNYETKFIFHVELPSSSIGLFPFSNNNQMALITEKLESLMGPMQTSLTVTSIQDMQKQKSLPWTVKRGVK